ncbi:MAG: hypothetical protein Q4E51_08615 [Lachnospiraceae bacterium]|nr:hypothetical protein [Lachnospiraceae bacterium]
MILFVFPILALIIYIIYEISEYGFGLPDGDQVFGAIVSVIITFIISFLIFMIASVIPGEGHVLDVKSKNLYALQDNVDINGSYFLGCGSTGRNLEYYYVYMTEDGGYKTDKISAENITVYYTDEDYRIDTVYFEFDNIVHRFLGAGYTEYRAYIPRGSILQNYLIDLQ